MRTSRRPGTPSTPTGATAGNLPSRFLVGDLSALPASARYDLVVGIQVFRTAPASKPTNTWPLRLTASHPEGCSASASTPQTATSTKTTTASRTTPTVASPFATGPKTGLNIHFFTADELRDVIGTSFTEVVPLRSHSTPRIPPGHGQWSQWEAIWQQRPQSR